MNKYITIIAALAVLPLAGCDQAEFDGTIENSESYTWKSTTSAVHFDYPADFNNKQLTASESGLEITEEITAKLTPEDALISIDEVHFTDEKSGTKLPLRAIFFKVGQEDTVRRVLPTVLSASANYTLKNEEITKSNKVPTVIPHLDVLNEDETQEGRVYLFLYEIEGETTSYAALFFYDYSNTKYFKALESLVLDSLKVDVPEDFAEKFKEKFNVKLKFT